MTPLTPYQLRLKQRGKAYLTQMKMNTRRKWHLFLVDPNGSGWGSSQKPVRRLEGAKNPRNQNNCYPSKIATLDVTRLNGRIAVSEDPDNQV